MSDSLRMPRNGAILLFCGVGVSYYYDKYPAHKTTRGEDWSDARAD